MSAIDSAFNDEFMDTKITILKKNCTRHITCAHKGVDKLFCVVIGSETTRFGGVARPRQVFLANVIIIMYATRNEKPFPTLKRTRFAMVRIRFVRKQSSRVDL